MNYEELNKDELIKEINRLNRDKKYGILFEEKPEEVDKYLDSYYPVFKNITDKDIITDENEHYNFLIEGDNLHSLSVLSVTHYNQISLIIIDPPYNTGNKDFIFNDHYVDAEDAWKHSKWLSFMKRRLDIARELLTDDGVIFIHIDEHEFAQLKMLCDEVFYEKNFIGTFIWKARSGKGGTADKISTQHEYIFCYAKDKSKAHLKTDKKISVCKKEHLRQWGQEKYREDRKTMFFPLLYNPATGDKSIISIEEIELFFDGDNFLDDELNKLKEKYENRGWKFILPISDDNKFGRWRGGYNNILELLRKDEITFELDKSGNYFAKKIIPEGNVTETAKDSLLLDYGTASTGTEELKRVFNDEKTFDTTKPFEVTKFLIDISTYNNPNAIILDFFAGSGTTGIAVMLYNKEHGGNRKFILCTNNEVTEKQETKLKKEGIQKGSAEYEKEGVCQKVTYPRLSKIMGGYTFNGSENITLFERNIKNLTELKKVADYIAEIELIKKEQKIEYEKFSTKFENGKLRLIATTDQRTYINGIGGNLKYFKTDFVGKAESRDYTKIAVASKVYEMLSIKENCFELVQHDTHYRIYKRNHKIVGMYTYFLDSQLDNLLNFIKSNPAKEKVLYSYSNLNTVANPELMEIVGIDVRPIPTKIIEMLDRIHKMG